jgi:hypothetical protein
MTVVHVINVFRPQESRAVSLPHQMANPGVRFRKGLAHDQYMSHEVPFIQVNANRRCYAKIL